MGRRVPPDDVMYSWPTPNYVDPVTRAPGIRAGMTVSAVLALVAVGMRLYIRMRVVRKVGVDDWLVGAAMVGWRFSFLNGVGGREFENGEMGEGM